MGGLVNKDVLSAALGEFSSQGYGGTGSKNPGFLEFPFDYGSQQYKDIIGDGSGGPLAKTLTTQLVDLGYISEIVPTILKTADDQLVAANLDSRVIQMLLGDIAENTEDMVDGIYNLPSDGTFYVPYTGAYATKGGAGATGEYDSRMYTVVQSINNKISPSRVNDGRTSSREPWRYANPTVKSLPLLDGVSTPYDILNQMGASSGANQTQEISITVETTSNVHLDGYVLAREMSRYLAAEVVRGGSARRISPILTF